MPLRNVLRPQAFYYFQGHLLCSRAEKQNCLSCAVYVYQIHTTRFFIWIHFLCCPERKEQSNFLFTAKFQVSNFVDLEIVRKRLLDCVHRGGGEQK